MTQTGIIVLAHGSRGERGKGEVEHSLSLIAAGLKPLLTPNVEITVASLQFNKPDIVEAVASLSAKGVTRIIIAPYFLFPGRHITEHIPQTIGELHRTYPNSQFILADNMGMDGSFINLMAKRIKKAAPDLTPAISINRARAIEQESMRIIDSLMSPLPFRNDEEIAVVKRIVHACGDVEIARLVRFSPSAISDGLKAIVTGSPFYTDVRMVMAGIDSHLARRFSCALRCSLDETDVYEAVDEGNTRTSQAMSRLEAKLNGAITAIGNAPTALLALLDLIDKKGVRPALVVGMPVGFIKAMESKEELMKKDIPYITVTGTRGGSAMASSTVNALLRIAAERQRKE